MTIPDCRRTAAGIGQTGIPSRRGVRGRECQLHPATPCGPFLLLPTTSDRCLRRLPPPAGVRSSCESPERTRLELNRPEFVSIISEPADRICLSPRECTAFRLGARRSLGHSTDALGRTFAVPTCDRSRSRYGGAWRTGEWRIDPTIF
jgi:hypothetical protein